ncbi:PRD domain-containing protein [Peribacillus simplex]|uniref:BglG family transcription antiterminator n=1 Tax=Peribacillus simplex TaxID=1478 RepID=UPI000F63C481|nr:BglG family transcription antiterminator [Peribacillus simplex]RRN73799.1 PRD domain-containing protein [Peribacillus simplex]
MYITSREKSIIELIIKTSGKHTALSIATQLNVSVRTVQRDLKSIEKILKSFELHLTRNTHEGLSIDGKNEQVFRLVQHLMGNHPIDQTPQERKLHLLLALLQEESYKTQVLAGDLGISITTLTTYLDELTEWLKNFNIVITRKRGVGIELAGTEENKRKAQAAYFLHFFNEELIESLFLLQEGKFPEAKILDYFDPEYLLAIDGVLNSTFNSVHSRLADSGYIGLIVHIYVTLQRNESQFYLEKDFKKIRELSDENNLMNKIGKELSTMLEVSFTIDDISYLAAILKGSKLHAADAVPYDSVLLGQLIRNLIKDVSAQLQIDLTKDFPLYQGLLAHMEPSLFRIKQEMGLYNPLTEDIKRKYPVLFLAVKTSLEKGFKEITDFPEDEIAFIVLHFGSALVLREEEISIRALIVCPTGIGTSKMLASRIKKEIMEIQTVEIKTLKDIQQQGSLKNYDVIISTVRLPYIDMDYILVSPLLSEENILNIRNYLRKNIENFTKNKRYGSHSAHSLPKKEAGELKPVLQELKEVQQSIESIMENFRFHRLPHLNGHPRIIEEMVRMAEKEELLMCAEDVIGSLNEREKKGGLGIPGTGMGLFHTRHKNVKKLIFQVAHLEEYCLIKGMDGNEVHMKNLLLMLAPEELSVRQQEIVSLISSSLIESNESIMIFSSSDEEMIRRRLEAIFLDYLYTNLIKG